MSAPPPANMKAEVKAFLQDVSQMQREAEIIRVLKAFQYNPYDLLDLPSNAEQEGIKKKYRSLSLLCHPDKCKPEFRDKAQKAFTLLAKAKADLTEDDKRPDVDVIVVAAREKVKKKKEAEAGKAKRDRQRERAKLAAEKSSLLTSGEGAAVVKEVPPEPEGPVDVTQDENFEALVKQEIKEMVIEREWRKRQMLKAAQLEEAKMAEEAAEKKAKADAEKSRSENWEGGRTKRVSSWRDFNKKGKKAKKLKMPKMMAEDEVHSYVRRPPQRKNAF